MLCSRRSIFSLAMLGMTVLTACQDPLTPPSTDGTLVAPRPQFAQGDNGTWTVNSLADPGDGTCDDTECTLREAIAAAAWGDRIVFRPGLQGSILLTAGELEITRSLAIEGAGIKLDAQQASRVMRMFALDPTEPVVTLSGLTFTNGLAGGGGGVSVARTELTMEGVSVTNNTATNAGGGISVFQAEVTLRNSTVSANAAGTDGGGIESDRSTLTILHSTVAGNTAVGSGGGIYSEFPLTVTASTIQDNESQSRGGGIYASGSVAMEGSTIANNDADQGGGLYLVGTTASIDRSTISGNQTTSFNGGAGIYNGTALQIRNSTIVGNSANAGGAGGGIFADGNTFIANSIVAGNEAVQPGSENCATGGPGGIGSLGHTMSEQNRICGPLASGDIRLIVGQLFTEVLETQLKDNGGPTQTYALIVRGRAVDAGYCPGETTDQRDLARPIDDPVMPNALDACDIGAYELQGPFVARTDLIVSQSANKTSVKAGDLLTYTVRVQNLGPETAPNVVLTNVLSSGVTFVSATHGKGTHTAPPAGETGTVTWYLGDLLDQGNETTDITVTVRVKGKTTITNKADVASDAVDPNPANNTASLTVSVAAGSTKPPGKGK
jgi:uncharacterized repeat protein (TIGR01451 family)/CSLREA domain-containing protein